MSQSSTNTIRTARPADAPVLQRLINQFSSDGLMLPRTLDEIYENLRDFQVCEIDGTIMGCVALHLIWSDLAEVKSLAVSSGAQGRGLGSDLVESALAEARRLDIPRVFALTFRPHFFERIGFGLIDKSELPQKIWVECLRCPKFPDCNEQAMLIEFDDAESED